MRIATSTIYAQQAATIDDQQALYAQIGQQLSSGKQLEAPGDDPSQIAQDLALHTTIGFSSEQSTNATNATAELTNTDSALSTLTSIMQSARQLAVQGSSDTLSAQQRTSLAGQVNQLLQQAVSVANTSYNGSYIFAGTSSKATPPVQAIGSPPESITFGGNEQEQGQLLYNGQNIGLSTTFASAFNYNAPNGSPDVFQTLINLRNTLQNGTAVDESSAAINRAGAVVYGPQGVPTSPLPTTLNAANTFATTPVADSTGNFSIEINGSVNGVQGVATITVPATAALDDGVPPPGGTSLVAQINAQTGTTGVTATYDPQTQKISLSGSSSFYVTDVASAGATNAGNLTAVLGLSSQADFVQNISTQLGDIDNATSAVLAARSVVGSRIQNLGSISSQLQTTLTDNQSTESSIEDVDVAAATSKYSQTQLALEAAYQTTTSLENKTLFNYLNPTSTG